jgi:hypothetical protein
MSRANGCDASGDAVVWSVVLALALAVAGLAARMLARATSKAATATGRNHPPAGRVVVDVEAFDSADSPTTWPAPASCSAGDPALALLAWLAALGWVTFNGARPTPWPWRNAQRARVWAAVFTSARPQVLG